MLLRTIISPSALSLFHPTPQVYPDQSLYPCNSVPLLVGRINAALQRADQIEVAEGARGQHDW